MDPVTDGGGGWMWIIIDVGAVALLGAAIAYVVMRYRRRFPGDTPQERSRQADHAKHVAERSERVVHR